MTNNVDTENLIYPFPRLSADAPAQEYTWLREHRPVVKVRTTYNTEAWLVTGYQVVRAVLADERFSSRMPVTAGVEDVEPEDDATRSLFNLDPPDHTRLRRLLAGSFTAPHVARLRPRITALADELVDRLVDSAVPADLVSSFVLPLTAGTIWEMLDVPARLRPGFQRWAAELREITEPSWDPDPTTNPVLINRIDLRRNIQALIAHRRAEPGDDLVSKLVAARAAGDIHDDPELTLQLTGLVIAGHEPTSNALGLALLAILRQPGRYQELRDHPEALPLAVEEILRYHVPTDIGFVRVATQDVELAGARINAGDMLILALESANRDADVFHDPETLDLTRADNPHLAFGHGRHHCLGMPLARLEISTALTVLGRRIPTLRLADPAAEIPRRTALSQLGPQQLVVTW